MTPIDLRTSAANMRAIASVFETNAIASTDPRMVTAWDDAMGCLLDAAAALEDGADTVDGVWRLPLPSLDEVRGSAEAMTLRNSTIALWAIEHGLLAAVLGCLVYLGMWLI